MREIPLEIRRTNHRYVIRIDSFSIDGIMREVESDRFIAVADARVIELYGLDQRIGERTGWRLIPAQAGEENKTASEFIRLCENILAGGIDRKSVVVALGGGVVGDMAGFAAATLLRGLRLVQVPTTLLAQVDSSVGGKTGVNLAGGKNLLGAFHQPDLVLIDPSFLATLPEREYLSGLAEVAKYGVLGDGEFFNSLVNNADAITKRDPATLAGVIEHCCRMKAAIVGDDERESERRQLLNLGHTFGHALEALAGYDGSLLHGEAVAIGTVLAAKYAQCEGMLEAGEVARILRGFERLGLPHDLPTLPTEGFAAALAQDKKSSGGGLTLVLPTKVGQCRIEKNVPVKKVANFMKQECENGSGQS